MFFLKQLKYLICRCTCQRISAIGGSMVSRNHCVCYSFLRCKCTYWNPASKSLCKSYDIWLYFVSLISKHGSCSAHSTLNFVKNQKNVIFITNFSYSFNKFGLCRINPPFSLYSLHNNRTGLFIDKCLHTFKIIVFRKLYSRY